MASLRRRDKFSCANRLKLDMFQPFPSALARLDEHGEFRESLLPADSLSAVGRRRWRAMHRRGYRSFPSTEPRI